MPVCHAKRLHTTSDDNVFVGTNAFPDVKPHQPLEQSRLNLPMFRNHNGFGTACWNKNENHMQKEQGLESDVCSGIAKAMGLCHYNLGPTFLSAKELNGVASDTFCLRQSMTKTALDTCTVWSLELREGSQLVPCHYIQHGPTRREPSISLRVRANFLNNLRVGLCTLANLRMAFLSGAFAICQYS